MSEATEETGNIAYDWRVQLSLFGLVVSVASGCLLYASGFSIGLVFIPLGVAASIFGYYRKRPGGKLRTQYLEREQRRVLPPPPIS